MMRFREVPKKLVQRLSYRIYKLLGRDWISGEKIRTRKDLKEIGSKYGGWVVPSSVFNVDSICYCVGCGEDISFDLGIIDLFGCHVFSFDPTPRAVAYVNKVAGKNVKYHFYEIGLWDEEDTLDFWVPNNPRHVSHSLLNLQKTDAFISVKVKRLAQIMKELDHKTLDLLKIDIEGAEYRVVESIIDDMIAIKVFCVEYDEFFNPLDANYRYRIRDSVKSLIRAGYTLVCSQGNGNYTFVKNI